jgi:hypothetical protein
MNKNPIKTAVILALFGALFLGVGSLFGTGGLVIGLLPGWSSSAGRTGSPTHAFGEGGAGRTGHRARSPQLYASCAT